MGRRWRGKAGKPFAFPRFSVFVDEMRGERQVLAKLLDAWWSPTATITCSLMSHTHAGNSEPCLGVTAEACPRGRLDVFHGLDKLKWLVY